MSLDAHLAGASRHPVWIACERCGTEWAGEVHTENGQAAVVPEDCPACGSGELSWEYE